MRNRWLLPYRRFRNLLHALGGRGHPRELVARLRAAYDEPHRCYHTARHIGACLLLLDETSSYALARRPQEVEAALWFHDAVYDTHADDNEERSALMAEESLRNGGVPAEVASRIAGYVRATRDHLATSSDGELVIDIDLAILGSDAVTFARFEQEIRREYGWVDAAQYAAGRTAALQHFVQRSSIYATRVFRERFESRARENIAASLRSLAEGVTGN